MHIKAFTENLSLFDWHDHYLLASWLCKKYQYQFHDGTEESWEPTLEFTKELLADFKEAMTDSLYCYPFHHQNDQYQSMDSRFIKKAEEYLNKDIPVYLRWGTSYE